MTNFSQATPERKGMEPLFKIGAALIILIAIIAIPSCNYVSAYNRGNEVENGIKAQYDVNQNSLSTLSNTVLEQAQVPEMARDDLIAVVKEAMQGRYGNDKNLLGKMVTEAYPGTLDPALYTRIQDSIESGRRRFANDQNMLVDKVRVYRTELGSFWSGFWLRVAGYPKINLDDYKIITSEYSNESFRTGTDKGLQLRNK